MNALELEVKKLKDKESRDIQNKKTAQRNRINNDEQYTRLFYSKNFPLVMNGDATINGRIEGDSLKFLYKSRELEIRDIGNPGNLALYGLTKSGSYENYTFNHSPNACTYQEQLICLLKEYF